MTFINIAFLTFFCALVHGFNFRFSQELLRGGGGGGGGPFGGGDPCPESFTLSRLPEKLPLELTLVADALTEVIDFEMKKTNTTSLAIGITYGDQVIYKKTFCQSCQKPVTEDTLFRIGSISKVFTVLMLMKLRDMGKVYLDEPVSKYWPEFSLNTSYPNSRGISFWDIAGQVSGLPTGTPCKYLNNGCNITTLEALKRLKSYNQVYPNDWFPHYSDLGYALLGRLLERPAGTTWENFLTTYILNPLGLRSTNWVFDSKALSLLAEPRLANLTVLDQIAFADILWARPTGGMYTTLNDLMIFTKMFVDANEQDTVFPSNASIPLTFSSLREMMQTRHVNRDVLGSGTGFGSPLEIFFTKGADYWVKSKGGFWPGFTSQFLVIPELKLGISVLSNNVGALGAGGIAVKLFARALVDFLKKHQPAVKTPPNIQNYVGKYYVQDAYPIVPDKLFMEISLSEDKTTLLTSTGPLVWTGQGQIFLTSSFANTTCINLEIGSSNEPVNFQVDNNGKVLGFYYPESDPFYNYFWLKQ